MRRRLARAALATSSGAAAILGVAWLAAWGMVTAGRSSAADARSEPLDVRAPAPTRGPLRVHPTNPRYFADVDGRAVLLAGAHTWYALQDSGWSDPPPTFDYVAYLDGLQRHGQNFFRMFVWEQAASSVLVDEPYYYAPHPFRRTGPGLALDGKPKFDLTAFDDGYFDRLRDRVREAGRRGIYVAVQLFNGFSVEPKPFAAAHNPWPGHPFNGANNVNGIDADTDRDGRGGELYLTRNPAVTMLQDAYVRRVLDVVGDLDNVLFEICNEGHAESMAWQARVIDAIRAYERERGEVHPVGLTVTWPGGSNDELFASAADWVSPNARGDEYREPPVGDGRKVVVNDTDHLCYPCGDPSFVWRSVTRGLNPAFMDPYDCASDVAHDCVPSAFEPVRANLGYARALLASTALDLMTPRPELCSTGFCLASTSPGAAEVVAYLPSGGTAANALTWLGVHRHPRFSWPLDSRVTVDLSTVGGSLDVEWLELATGRLHAGETVVGGAPRTLTAPFDGDAVLHLHHGHTRRSSGA